ncbi:PREDICTED: desiccation protectant protein Lea14 homolog [Prunus mume]|uniref:Desiccation protectant protein Lea14 homolog n=1 Tax=Prunus mume TaxID=102107 RepID=A0ABM1LRI7_PRUMU|nr:PREDICTED: desiccation protectant protein Lea14 homolog [Prunus mume]
MQRSATFVSTAFSNTFWKVSQLAGYAKNYVVNLAKGFLEGRLAEMKKRSALIVGLQFENLNVDSIELVFKISVYNPFEFYLPVSRASFKLKSGSGSDALSATLKEPASLKPGEESILLVLAKVPFSMFMTLAKDISEDADIDYEIDFNIQIKLPIIGAVSLPIPCKQQGQLKISDLFTNLLKEIN